MINYLVIIKPDFKLNSIENTPIKTSKTIELVNYSSGVPLTYPDNNFGNEYAAIVSNKFGNGKITLSSPEPYNPLDIEINKNTNELEFLLGLVLQY